MRNEMRKKKKKKLKDENKQYTKPNQQINKPNQTKPTPKWLQSAYNISSYLPRHGTDLDKGFYYVCARAPKYTGEACMTQSNCTALTHRAKGLVV